MADAVQNEAFGSKSYPPRRRLWLWASVAMLGLGGLGLWALRTPIADNLVADQLKQRDVAARYQVAAIGPRTQRLENVVIGNADRPDLTARSVELDIRWTWSGPQVAAVRADGVRLFGRWADGKLNFGALDKLIPPTDSKDFSLPDLDLTISDARAQIATPWGRFGIGANGQGPLRDGFVAEIAVVTDKAAVAQCVTGRSSAYGKLRITDNAPHFAGPVRGRDLKCQANGIAIDRMDAQVEANFSQDLRNWNGVLDLALAGADINEARVNGLTVDAKFQGTAERTTVDFFAAASGTRYANAVIADASAKGIARFDGPNSEVTGYLRFAGARPPEQLLKRLNVPAAAQSDPLTGPIVSRYFGALRRAAEELTGQVDFSATTGPAFQQITLSAPRLASRSGAALRADKGSEISIRRTGTRWAFAASGGWSLAGGGLPAAKLQLDRRSNGAIRGLLRLEPLIGGSSRLALAPIAFRGEQSGRFLVSTQAVASGPIAGGRIDGLALPINATIEPGGLIRLASGCQRLRLDSAEMAGVRLERNQFELCSAPNQPLLAFGSSGLSGALHFPQPKLTGNSGDNSLLVQAQRARLDLATLRWDIELADLTMGGGEEPTRFLAKQIRGESVPDGFAGRIEGAAGTIGVVPLDMAEMGADWRYNNGQLRMNGGLVVRDRAQSPRFNPLISSDVVLTFADGQIAAEGNFAERETGARIGNVTLSHNIEAATGAADLAILSMRFNDQFQPDQLTPLALGVIANTKGTLAGRGRIDWVGQNIQSSGSFTTAGSDFAAAFGSVQGASTTIVFDDLLKLRSAPNQRISFDEINPGFSVLGGTIDYQMLDATKILIEGGQWPFGGGELILKPTTLDFDVNAVRRLEFELRGVDAAIFLTELGFQNISASGVFDGILPVEFSGLGGRIVGGRLIARAGGGQVSYIGELTNYDLGIMANFAFNMLKSLRYDAMEISLNGDLDGEMLTDVKIGGLQQGDLASRNLITRQLEKLPIEFNVRINAPFRQLISSAKSFYDPSVLIDQNLFSLIEAQRSANEPSVQPPESDKVP